MKKLISVVLILSIIFSLIGCHKMSGKNKNGSGYSESGDNTAKYNNSSGQDISEDRNGTNDYAVKKAIAENDITPSLPNGELVFNIRPVLNRKTPADFLTDVSFALQ